jgi:hypothetical protein
MVFLSEKQISANPEYIFRSNPSLYVSDELWMQSQDYLIPDNHPMKEKLDQIFSRSRASADQKSMLKAGFKHALIQQRTKILITKHPELPGHIIKVYLDNIQSPEGIEHDLLIKRIEGARLIQKSIHLHHYEHLFKVPQKWLYLLPDSPTPPSHYSRKFFVLIEDDMDIFNDKKNEKLWQSEQVTPELLNALYTLVTELCLSDSAKPSNCTFSRDGRLAFVDTQNFYTGYTKYYKLTPYLSPSMRRYWENLIASHNKK